MYKVYLILAFTIFSLQKGITQNVQNVDPKTFLTLVESGNGVILDVRTQGEYSRGHIKNSTLISTNDPNFVNKVSLLQKDKPIYIYCLTGARSARVARYLSQKGYTKLYNLTSGLMSWQRSGYTLVQSSNAIASTSTTYSTAQFKEILALKQFVFADFYAPWCSPCKKMMPIIDQLEKDYPKVLIKKIDIEANKTLKDNYSMNAIPGFILFKDGKEVWRNIGVLTSDQLKQVFDHFLSL